MVNHAVLTDRKLVKKDPNRGTVIFTLSQPIASFNELWRVGQAEKIDCFWIVPGSSWDELTGKLEIDDFDIFVSYEDEKKKERPKFARFWKRDESGQQIRIGWGHRGRFLWNVAKNSMDILKTVSLLEENLGVPCFWSPGHIGWTILTSIHKGKEDTWLRKPTIDMQEIPYRQAARDLLFLRPLEATDVGKWDHCVDKSSAHIGGCIDLLLGEGTPGHMYLNQKQTQRRSRREAGIYKIKFDTGYSKFDGKTLPLIINTEWVTTEILNLAISEGYNISIEEAWVFRNAHKVLKPVAERLWAARAHLKDVDEDGYFTSKQVALILVGKLAEEYPHWWSAVVGKARAIMLYNLISEEAHSGLTPFLIYSDEMHYVSSLKDPREALGHMFHREGKLGGYKLKYSLQITEEIVQKSKEYGIDSSPRVGKMQGYLQKLWQTKMNS